MKTASLATLKIRFFLVTVTTTFAVALAVVVANQLAHNLQEERFLEMTIGSKHSFWNHMVSRELERMETHIFSITRDRPAIKALIAGDRFRLIEQIRPTYNRLWASNVVTRLQIADRVGNILVSYPQEFTGPTQKKIVRKAIEEGRIMRGIERDDDGELLAIVASPLYAKRGELIGVAVLARNLLGVLEVYMEHDGSIAFIADKGRIIGLPVESQILPDVSSQIPALGEDAYSVERLYGRAYQVIVLSIEDFEGVPLAHFVAFTDYTQAYSEETFVNYTVYAIIILMLVASIIWLYWYVMIESARLHEADQLSNEELAIANEKLQEAIRIKSQFLANMSHELRTPLNSIIGFSGALLKGIDGELNPEQRTSIRYVYNSGQHLLDLINDVLDLSKIEAGKMVLNLETMDLRELINETVESIAVLFRNRDIELKVNMPENIPTIYGDNKRIKQVMLNILSNAAKFTDQGEVVVECGIVPVGDDRVPEYQDTSVTGQTHWALIAIRDSGIGIRREDQPKVFEEFRQIDGSSTRKHGGTGLGMAISRRIIELHGGRLWLESEYGEGTTFFFTLPHIEEEQSHDDDTGMAELPGHAAAPLAATAAGGNG